MVPSHVRLVMPPTPLKPSVSMNSARTVRPSSVSTSTGRSVIHAPLVKEVETICLYDRLPSGQVRSVQRTATFLVPDATYTSGSSFVEQQAVRMTRGPSGRQLAIDVRIYDLLYEPVTNA